MKIKIVTIVLLLLFTLTGCGGGSSSPTISPSPTPSPSPSPSPVPVSGTLTVSGTDTGVIDTTFAPNEVTMPDATTIRWRHIINGGGGMGTITHAFMLTLTSGGSVSTISYAQNIGSDTYQYFSSCDINDCSGITVDAGARTITVNNVGVPASGAGLESAAITLNGTLSYASAVLPAPSTDSSLVGTWKATCYTYGSNYATTTINATDVTNASLTREVYDNNLCSGSPTMVISLTIVYGLGNTFTASGVNVKELDYAVTEENGVVDPTPITMFDLVYIDSSNVLYFGLTDTTHDATSPSKRPAAVDFSVQYVKQ